MSTVWVSIQVLATPISGLLRSLSVNPTALNIARAPARSRPSVISRLRCLGSMGIDYARRTLMTTSREAVMTLSSRRPHGLVAGRNRRMWHSKARFKLSNRYLHLGHIHDRIPVAPQLPDLFGRDFQQQRCLVPVRIGLGLHVG